MRVLRTSLTLDPGSALTPDKSGARWPGMTWRALSLRSRIKIGDFQTRLHAIPNMASCSARSCASADSAGAALTSSTVTIAPFFTARTSVRPTAK